MLDLKQTARWNVLVLAAAALVGCAEDDAPLAAGDFVSDNPYGGGGSGNGSDPNGDPTEGDPTGGDSGGDDGSGDDGSRDIAEADIVHIEGDRLYALSRYGGLSIIDVSTPDQLPVLGRYRAHAEPFEMYVDAGQVFIMYQGWGEYAEDPETGAFSWQTTSRLMALDASDPAAIGVAGDFSVPGYLSDSRRVGDVMYVVTKEDEWCWSCEGQSNATVITSLDVSDETAVEVVDQLRLEDEQGWGGIRSLSATDERLYIAGPDWSGDDGHSTIEVIDISDPGGLLVAGASVEVAGQVNSRWQMDEHDGVLRVISQPGWGGDDPPRIETFSIGASDDIVPLGSLDMTLPRPESLQSVRFDGPHAYAITFEQTDPLFTIDLSDPATPQQVGELEIPGFVYHMETRGDRVLGIGFDRGNEQGSINASLFDVSDFANPTMIERVHFGGDWASFGEDQDRVHKSFQVLDDLGLLLVPFSGWIQADENEEGWGCGRYESGIQLIDWADDTLALRGVAPMRGTARRALVHDDRLLGISDQSVEVFDVADRDDPTRTTDLALASQADRVAMGDGVLVRLANDWWTGETRLDVVDAATPESATALGSLSLDVLAPDAPDGPEAAEWGCFHYGYYDAEMFAHAGFVYLVRDEQLWDYEAQPNTMIDVIDISDPTAPVYVDTLEVEGNRGWGSGPALSNDEQAVRIIGDAMVIVTREQEWEGESDALGTSHSTFQVVDLSNPGAPVLAQSLPRPDAVAHGALQAFDGVAVSWHMREVAGDGGKVRFYLDRVELDSPAQAELAASVNVPGAVVAWDESSSRAVVADFQLEPFDAANEEECWSHPGASYSYTDDACAIAHRSLHLVQVQGGGAQLLDTAELEGDDGALRGAAASDERLFVHVQRGNYQGWSEDGGGPTQVPEAEVTVFADWPTGDLSPEGSLTLPDGNSWLSSLTATGNRLVFRAENGLGEIDATDPAAPSTEFHDLWGYYCADLQTDGDMAYCAMGPWGIQAVELD